MPPTDCVLPTACQLLLHGNYYTLTIYCMPRTACQLLITCLACQLPMHVNNQLHGMHANYWCMPTTDCMSCITTTDACQIFHANYWTLTIDCMLCMPTINRMSITDYMPSTTTCQLSIACHDCYRFIIHLLIACHLLYANYTPTDCMPFAICQLRMHANYCMPTTTH